MPVSRAPDPAAPGGDPVLDWLLAGDPAIRWQTMRDLLALPAEVVAAERARVGREGWGARLLAEQDPDGGWAGALYSPKWTSTTYTLLLLRRLGLPRDDPRALRGCRLLWDSATWFDGGLTFARTVRQPETCITGMLLLLDASSGLRDERADPVAQWLLDQQLDDGGWNCESIRSGSAHGSFHTSITVLEALHAYRVEGRAVAVDAAVRAGQEFFLQHRLYRSHRSGEVVDPAFTRFPFPPRWHFDVVRGLEHFVDSGAARDERLADGVDAVRRSVRRDGTWPTFGRYPGREWFRMESRGPGRWSTLRARRVLAWWDAPDGSD